MLGYSYRILNFIISLSLLLLFTFHFGCHSDKCCIIIEGPQVELPLIAISQEPAAVTKVKTVSPPGEKKTKEVKTQEKTPLVKPPTPATKTEIIPEGTGEEPFFSSEPKQLKTDEIKANLQVTLEAEPKGSPQNPHLIKCVIKNNGNNTVDKYQLKIALPDGLSYEPPQDKAVTVHDFSSLKPNETNTHEFKVVAKKVGQYTLRAELIVMTEVIYTTALDIVFESKPDLALVLDGPLQVNVESQFEYTITVTNRGQIALSGITVQHQLQASLVYITSTPEGSHKNENNRITWKIKDLLPGEQKVMKVKVTAITKGDVYSKARAKDEKNLVLVHTEIKTEVVGAIGLQIQHFDTQDPVEVGDKTTYVIEMLNQGHKDSMNVEVTNIIPAESSFVSAQVEGIPNINYIVQQQKIQFDTIKALQPKQKVIFRVTVKVEKVGDLLNTVEVRSDEFIKPIIKQEGTKSYQK